VKLKFYLFFPVAIIVVGLCLSMNLLDAQDTDWGIWSETGLTKEFNKWQYTGVLEIYTEEHSRQFDRISFINITRFSLTNWLDAGFALMPMRKWTEDGSEWRLRHYYYLQGSLGYGSYKFSVRERFEFTNYPVFSGNDFEFVTRTWRNQFKVSRDITGKPLTISGWVESFAPFNKENPLLEEFRYAVSCTYLPVNTISVEPYLLYYQRRANDMFIFGINCYFTI